ncbi:hypothetical protein [Actinoplanes sp. NPDC026623]|uniref:hypothetical protein n=1 Tax=Actinoplanes sp. NPDC026623 TaxID=3155610 RepID=UPI0033DC4B41
MTDAYPAADPRNGFGSWLRTLCTAAWVLVGGCCVAIGLYLGGRNANAYEPEWNVSVFSSVVIVGGIVMIAQARQRPRTGRAGRIAGAIVTVVGLLAGSMAPMQKTCCDAFWSVSLGLPLPWATGGGDTWSQALGDAWHGTWDPLSAVANAIFWASAGMIVAVVIGLYQRGKRT